MPHFMIRWWWFAPLSIGTLLVASYALSNHVEEQVRIEASLAAEVPPEQVAVSNGFTVRLLGFDDPSQRAEAESRVQLANGNWRIDRSSFGSADRDESADVDPQSAAVGGTQEGEPEPPVSPSGSSTTQAAFGRQAFLDRVDQLFAGSQLFDSVNPTVRPEAEPMLAEVAEMIQSHPELGKLKVIGHTDTTGDAAVNENLGLQRARSVIECLVMLGADEDRLLAESQGENQPVIAVEQSEADLAANRRIEWALVDQ